MEVLPLPLGVTPPSTATATTSHVDVVLGGATDGWTGLSQGTNYYADTMGRLVKGDSYKGRESTAEFAYVVDSATGTIVTAEGKIGFAASSDAMFVHT